MLELSGNAQVKQKEDVFRAQQITLNLDTQSITLSGNVKGSVTESPKEETKVEKVEDAALEEEAAPEEEAALQDATLNKDGEEE